MTKKIVFLALHLSYGGTERAIALEVRGFGAKGLKTWMHPHQKTKADRIFSWLCIAGLILALAGRIYLWLF